MTWMVEAWLREKEKKIERRARRLMGASLVLGGILFTTSFVSGEFIKKPDDYNGYVKELGENTEIRNYEHRIILSSLGEVGGGGLALLGTVGALTYESIAKKSMKRRYWPERD